MSKLTEARVLRAWTDEEYGLVASSDKPIADLAAEMGRTRHAVQKVRNKLRAGWVPNRAPGWSEDEDALLLSTLRLPAKDVAASMGRTVSAVHQRRHSLKSAGEASGAFGGNVSPYKPGARPMLAKTCPECGLLLQAKWFRQDGERKAWSRQCRRCFRAGRGPEKSAADRVRSEASKYALQTMTLPGAVNHNKPWLEEDMKVLADPDMTRLEKALALQRTYHSVCNAVRKFDFPSKVGLGDPERDQWMIDNPNADRVPEIAVTTPAPTPDPTMTPARPAFDWDD